MTGFGTDRFALCAKSFAGGKNGAYGVFKHERFFLKYMKIVLDLKHCTFFCPDNVVDI